MCRGAAARRRRPDTEGTLAVCGRVEGEEERLSDQAERLRDENAGLRERVAEVEGWYRLLEADHAALKDNDRRNSRRTTELQAEVNRLDVENQELSALVSRPGWEGQADKEKEQEGRVMLRMAPWIRGLQRHKWAAAALMTIGTLLARDAAVQGVFAGAMARVRQVAGSSEDHAGRSDGSGFVRYAAMINSRDQLDRARKEYNEGEAKLKGDALLEAQDRLRAARTRYREARLAFLPELARHCDQARVALPRESAEALAALKGETTE